ncbi:nef attachable domain protein, partial [Chlamydia psittaci 02DC14]
SRSLSLRLFLWNFHSDI